MCYAFITTTKRGVTMGTIVVNGTEYGTLAEACKAYKVPLGVVKLRLERGWDLDKAVTYSKAPDPFRKTKYDLTLNGVKYTRFNDIGVAYNMNSRIIMERVYMGESLESIVADPYKEYTFTIEGITYKSMREMARVYGHEPSLFYNRALVGTNIHYMLYENERGTVNTRKSGRMFEFKGKNYGSLASFCEEFDLPYTQVSSRLQRGDSLYSIVDMYAPDKATPQKNGLLEKISLSVVQSYDKTNYTIVYNDVGYNSIDELVADLGLNKFALASLVRAGFDLDYAVRVELAFKKG